MSEWNTFIQNGEGISLGRARTYITSAVLGAENTISEVLDGCGKNVKKKKEKKWPDKIQSVSVQL